MSWSERIKLTFNTFKRIALPLYLWYLIFSLAAGLLALLIFLLSAGQMLIKYFESMDHFNFTPKNYAFTQMAYNSNSSLYPFNNLFLINYLPVLLIVFFLLCVIGFVAASVLYTGTYHLTVKGLQGKASFRDFKISSCLRMMGWYIFVFLFYLLFTVIGLGLFWVLDNVFKFAVGIYLTVSVGILILGSIFILPWLLCGGYYVLAQRKLSFGKAIRNSWSFFRRNMGTLWGAVFAVLLMNIAISLIRSEISTLIGGWILSFLIAPFTSLIPIVWTITLMNEGEEFFSLSYEGLSSSNSHNGFHNENLSIRPYCPENFEDDEIFYYCSSCGSKVQPNAAYCSDCGIKLR